MTQEDKEHPHGEPPGQAKKDEEGGAVGVSTFAITPPEITSDGNTCTVHLPSGGSYTASSEYAPDDGSTGWTLGSSVSEDTDNETGEGLGVYRWYFQRAFPAGSGDVITKLQAPGSVPMDPPAQDPDGVDMIWPLRYEG